MIGRNGSRQYKTNNRKTNRQTNKKQQQQKQQQTLVVSSESHLKTHISAEDVLDNPESLWCILGSPNETFLFWRELTHVDIPLQVPSQYEIAGVL